MFHVESPKKKVFIAIPSCRDWKIPFGSSMTRLASHLTSRIIYQDGIEAMIIRCQVASLLPAGREMLLEMAIKEGYTHILWIDDDTDFSPEAVDYLLSRDVDFVAANFCRKQFPLTFTALGKDGNTVDSANKKGIEEVHQVGLGMALMKLSCLKDIPKPRFQVLWWEKVQQYVGEDIYLCHILREKGVKMYVDHDASNVIGHVGDFAYKFEAAKEVKKDAA